SESHEVAEKCEPLAQSAARQEAGDFFPCRLVFDPRTTFLLRPAARSTRSPFLPSSLLARTCTAEHGPDDLVVAAAPAYIDPGQPAPPKPGMGSAQTTRLLDLFQDFVHVIAPVAAEVVEPPAGDLAVLHPEHEFHLLPVVVAVHRADDQRVLGLLPFQAVD